MLSKDGEICPKDCSKYLLLTNQHNHKKLHQNMPMLQSHQWNMPTQRLQETVQIMPCILPIVYMTAICRKS
eukprot:8523999-Ditylum_brightwellii.AAC.1